MSDTRPTDVDAGPEPAERSRTKLQTSRPDSLGLVSLPPLAALLARPWLLVLGALLGLIVGAGLAGSQEVTSQASVQFTNAGTDSLRVKQIGQTVERQATSSDVLAAAQRTLGDDDDLGTRIKATWEADTELVNVTARTADADAAVAEANAVVDAMVSVSEKTIATRLSEARAESNRLLKDQRLDETDAESARRAQLGSSLASRQDAISGEVGDLVVASRASVAQPAGLTRPMGAATGLVGGLLLAGVVSMLLGVRGLSARSERTVGAFVPHGTLKAPADAAAIAGRFLESGQSCLAVVAMDRTHDRAVALAADLAHFTKAQGPSVAVIDTTTMSTREEIAATVRRDARENVQESQHADLLIVIVEADGEACAMLEGQSDLRAVVVIRRGQSLLTPALRQLSRLELARPLLVMAR